MSDHPDFRNVETVSEARRYADPALGGINTLHLGPLDYNVATTADDLRTAAALIEKFGQEQRRANA